MMFQIQSAIVLLLACIANAARLTVSISSSSPILPNPASLPPSTHAMLIGPPGIQYDVPLRRDNSFRFPDLQEASYLLSIHTRDYAFPPLRVDVGKAADGSEQQTVQVWQTYRGNEWSNKGPSYGQGTGELEIQVQPSSRKDFYQQRGGFDIMSFLRSPMILMALVSVVFIFGLPKLMDSIDPEMRAEIEEMQRGKRGGDAPSDAVNQLQNFDVASWLAGRGSGVSSSSGGSAAGSGGSKR